MFQKEIPEESPNESPTFDWTQYYWHKASEKFQDMSRDAGQGSSRIRRQPIVGANKIQKKLDKMLAKPVKMSKAESMMQKMGWQGGALGRSGDGIVEPIAPNAVYAKTKIGFGQNHVQVLRSPKHKFGGSKQFYEMNVLLNIYEFVQNNSEFELLFDRNLKKDERKRIHNLVEYKIQADDFQTVDFDSPAQMDLVLQINDKNCYVLHTQSYGSYPVRQLCLYKLAPPHVYLLVPDDLRDEPPDLLTTTQNGEEILQVEIDAPKVPHEPQKVPEEPLKVPVESVTEDLEVEEETNPFLISITRNLKKKSDSECQEEKIEVPQAPEVPQVPEVPKEKVPSLPEMSKVMKKIVDFFIEFAEDKKFSQFKFLGPFNEEEVCAINEFIEQAVVYLSKEGECTMATIFDKVAFEINEDCTGNTV
uniref:G-patch domain-containing protein n=1 Tax=Heliothis virescens TaxID=7102 RepID=A0A2A4IRX3_HELVI